MMITADTTRHRSCSSQLIQLDTSLITLLDQRPETSKDRTQKLFDPSRSRPKHKYPEGRSSSGILSFGGASGGVVFVLNKKIIARKRSNVWLNPGDVDIHNLIKNHDRYVGIFCYNSIRFQSLIIVKNETIQFLFSCDRSWNRIVPIIKSRALRWDFQANIFHNYDRNHRNLVGIISRLTAVTLIRLVSYFTAVTIIILRKYFSWITAVIIIKPVLIISALTLMILSDLLHDLQLSPSSIMFQELQL